MASSVPCCTAVAIKHDGPQTIEEHEAHAGVDDRQRPRHRRSTQLGVVDALQCGGVPLNRNRWASLSGSKCTKCAGDRNQDNDSCERLPHRAAEIRRLSDAQL